MERLKLNIQRFATSGTLTTPGNSDGTSFYFYWSRQSYSIADNKSTIYWQIGINAAYSYYSNGVKLGPTTVNGTVIHSGGTYSNISRGTHTMFEGTMDIPHNPDGTKSFSASLSGWTWESTWTSADNSNNPFVLDTIPRYTTVSTWSVTSRTETSITLSWKTADTCSQIRYGTSTSSYTTANVNGNSGSVTISGLQAGQPYTLYFMPKRKDSSLWGDGSDSTWKSLANQSTYNYPNCTTAPDFTIGDSVTLQFSNPLNRTFAIRMWSHASQSFVTDSVNISGTSYTFTPNANNLYASIPNAKSSKYNIDCTYSGNKLVKTSPNNGYSVNENTNKPTFSDFTYADINSTTVALTGDNQKVVQGYSNIQATVSVANKATAKNSATMDHYDLIITGNDTTRANYSDNTDVTITTNGANSGSIKVNAVDSRNLAQPVEKTNVELIPYTNIQRGNISVTRAGNVGEATTLTFEGTMWGGNFGAVTNTITSVQYRYKSTAAGSSWSAYASLTPPTPSGNSYSFSGLIAGDEGNTGFSVDNSFNIEVVVADRLSSITFTATLGTGIPHVAFGNNGIAIKQPYDDNDSSVLQVNGATLINGQTKIKGTAADKPLMVRGIAGSDGNTTVDDLYLQYGTGKTVHFDNAGNTTIDSNGNMKVAKSIQIPKNSTAGYGLCNSDGSSIIRDWNNKNVTVDATGSGLYLGFQNTTSLNLLNGKGSLDSSGNLTISGKYKSTGISIVDAGNSWKKVDIGFCRVYFRNGAIGSTTYAANGWGGLPALYLPTNMTFNSSKMSFSGCMQAGDNALLCVCCLYNGQNFVWSSWNNKWSGTVTCDVRYNFTIIDFS